MHGHKRDKDRLEQILKSNINLKKILIIGGTGFLGYHSKKMYKKGWSVTSISTHKPKKIRFLEMLNIYLLI